MLEIKRIQQHWVMDSIVDQHNAEGIDPLPKRTTQYGFGASYALSD